MGLYILYFLFSTHREGVAMTLISLCEAAQLYFYSASKAGFQGTARVVVQHFHPGVASCLICHFPKFNWKALNRILKDDTLFLCNKAHVCQ